MVTWILLAVVLWVFVSVPFAVAVGRAFAGGGTDWPTQPAEQPNEWPDSAAA